MSIRRWLQSWVATLDVMLDKEARADLRAADAEPDEGLPVWDLERKLLSYRLRVGDELPSGRLHHAAWQKGGILYLLVEDK